MNISNSIRCLKKELKALAEQFANADDLDEQQLNVNCAEGKLEISGGNDVDLADLGTKTVYKLEDNTSPGVINREWHASEPAIPISASTTAAGRSFRLGHDFSLPVTTQTVTNGLDLNDTDNTAGEMDVQVKDTVILVPAGGIWIQYQGGSEGYWAIELGLCCGPLKLQDELGYADRLDANAIVGPVFIPEGLHSFRAWNIDSGGNNSAHSVRYSTDGTTFTNVLPAGVELSTEKREVECEEINSCDSIPEGWSVCPPKDCAPLFPDDSSTVGEQGPPGADGPQGIQGPPGTPGADGDDATVTLCTAVPIADNEADTAIRTGTAGTSTEVARCDHNHPIRRQANPGAPTLLAGGNATVLSPITTYRFWSDEEAVYFGQRYRFQQAAGTGWGWLTMPNIAGFQRPIVQELNTYRIGSTAVQDDNGSLGAGPRGPFMGLEMGHWSFTQRLYGAYFRRDNPVDMYVTLVLKYIRN